MNRLTQILVSLAAVMVIVLGTVATVAMIGNPFRSHTTDRAVPVPAAATEPEATGTAAATAPAPSRIRLGEFTELAPDLARAPLLIDTEVGESYRYKEIRGAALNQLYVTPQGERWLYPTNAQLILSIDDIVQRSGSATATLIQVVLRDTSGNGTLSEADGIRLILTAPDGTAPVILADDLAEPAAVSRGDVWRVTWQADSVTHLTQIDAVTGALGQTRTLSFPAK